MRVLMLCLSLLVVTLLAGCAQHALSPGARESIDPAIDYADVRAEPARHEGRIVLLAGQIVTIYGNDQGSTLEILSYSMDRYGYPRGVDEAGGRFLVTSQRFLDPQIYQPGYLVTLTGTAAGQQTTRFDGRAYIYPVFTLGEIRVWGYEVWPRPNYRYYPYDPWYYWPDPFWPHPPPRHRRPWW